MKIWDLESDGLLDTVTTVHCLAIHDTDTGITTLYGPDEIYQAIAELQSADLIAGHNIIKYDIPVLEKLYGFKPKATVEDTMLIAQLSNRDLKVQESKRCKPGVRVGGHGLKDWGIRLGILKGDYGTKDNAWDSYCDEMGEYCKQDVEVTKALYDHVRPKVTDECVRLEMQFATVISRQERYGWRFDSDAAEELYADLRVQEKEYEAELINAFGTGWWVPQGTIIPKANNKKLGYVKGVEVEKKPKWHTFNPNSRPQLAKVMIENGWKPRVLTDTGRPQVDEKTVKTYKGPGAEWILKYLEVKKRISMVATGKQAWLKKVKDGRIHGTVDTCGTVTGRCSHRSPNVAQVPSDHRFRRCFVADEDKVLVGCDASGLELRDLAHYMGDPDYIHTILTGDIHTANQEAAGLPTRDNAKTFI